MANWIVSRCDNPKQTDVVDIKFDGSPGQIISVNVDGVTYCGTLIESTEQEAKYGSDTLYDSCLKCLVESGVILAFKPCFDGKELIIPSNVLNFLPLADTVYKLNLSIRTGGKKDGKTIDINDCYIYGGYVDAKPEGDIRFNSDTMEYKTCEECNPYKSNKSKFDEAIAAPFKNAKELYPSLFEK